MREAVKAKTIISAALLFALCALASVARPNRLQLAHKDSCAGLHAGIRAVLQRRDASYPHPPSLDISFVLLNDSQEVIDSAPRTWKIAVNGNELGDSGRIFGNGPAPMGGYGKLNPGDSYEFGKALDVSKYFPKDGSYRVSWRGKGFRSSTIEVVLTSDQR